MKQLFLLFFMGIALSLTAQQSTFSSAKIRLNAENNAFKLARLGFDISHGDYAPGKHFSSAFSTEELELLRSAGFEYTILVEDLAAQFLAQNESETITTRTTNCDGGDGVLFDYDTPVNYEDGSMGGYFTYDEMLANLADMAAQYPDLISTLQPIEGFTSHEGRPILWARLSDNPNMDETDEPEVLYNAIHHAREPNGLSQMIFFLWYALENYESDPEIQYLVDNVEMYFVPVVNPDGYIYNEITNPNGGGFWRKNRRDNEDGTFGVDLNRNYGYEWGINDTGSSPNTESQVYRGTAPFSEPETAAMKAFCEDHEFQITLNYHTYSNLLIYPWGYDDSPTPDHETFVAMATAMTRENNYTFGTGIETVGYNVNGSSDDWMYGEQTTKPKTYAMTPEVGPASTGFWPGQENIDTYNKMNMQMNLTTAHLTLIYGLATDNSSSLLMEQTGQIDYSFQRLGLKEGDLTVSVSAVSDNITSVGAPQTYNLAPNETTTNAIDYTLANDIQAGEEVVFLLSVDNGTIVLSDTLHKLYFSGEPVLVDGGDNTDNWAQGTEWGVSNIDFVSAPSSIADSPTGAYSANEDTEIVLEEAVDVTDAVAVYLNYWARWEIENDYDYTQIMLSVNDGEYIPLCTPNTNLGVPDQDDAFDQPLYDGIQPDWVYEQICLDDYLNTGTETNFRVKFTFHSDGGVQDDGFYFDDLEFLVSNGIEDNVVEIADNKFKISTRPNPARDYALIETKASVENANLLIFNTLGQTIYQEKVSGDQFRIDTKAWDAGIYFYELEVDGVVLPARRLSIVQ